MSDFDGFERKLKNCIPERFWSTIRDRWLSFIPIIEPPGYPPNLAIHEHHALVKTLSGIDGFTSEEHQLSGLRELFFHEAIFLTHKASHILSYAQVMSVKGALTWSLSNAYQGAMLASKAVENLLGVTYIEHGGKQFVVDVWTNSKLIKPRNKNTSEAVGNIPVTIKQLDVKLSRLGHRHYWAMFQRLLRSTRTTPWNKSLVSALFSLDSDDFELQRNHLHYMNSSWIYQDLFEYSPSTGFAMHEGVIDKRLIPEMESDFSMVLGLSILKLAYDLIYDLGMSTNKLSTEIELIKSTMNDTRNPFYISNFPI